MSWEPGQEVYEGRYVIKRVLGQGGFGITYLAVDSDHRPVVIKTLKDQWLKAPQSDYFMNRFRDEAVQLAICRHPNIVEIDNVFSEGSLYCIVMEYIHGKDLKRIVLDQGILEETVALTYIQQVGSALAAVHKKGLLHRDVKPENIIICEQRSEAILIDFGIARQALEGTQSYTVAGTPAYSSPEQFRSKTRLGPYSDVYALAATLYYILTGEDPTSAPTRALGDDLEDIQELNPQITDRVVQGILKGLELRYEDRPQTIQIWLDCLDPRSSFMEIQEAQRSSVGTLPLPATLSPSESPQTRSETSTVQEPHLGSDGVSTIAKTLSLKADSALTKQGKQPPKRSRFSFPFETLTIDVKGTVIDRQSFTAEYHRIALDIPLGFDLVRIPAGQFMMGSPLSERGRDEDESPQHLVTFKSPFWAGKFPVTQSQWRAVVTSTKRLDIDLRPEPSTHKGDDLPVETISWYEAVEFCRRLSRKTGREYRLPTEAEWEYACRAGTETPFHFGENIKSHLANFASNASTGTVAGNQSRTTPIGSYEVANAFGLYDMHGNVWEWCADPWHPGYQGAPEDGRVWEGGDLSIRVMRGGSWFYIPRCCRSAFRGRDRADNRNVSVGFRVFSSD